MAYETVIGLEVHCQLATATKLFCSCSTKFGAAPNHQVCPICLGMPGVLPVLNTKAVDYAVQVALALGAQVAERSVFARKQYFYPDLPKGYQITQYDRPYCVGGGLTIGSGQFVRLTRIHLEEDAGKNVHAGDISLVDCNRAGTPLIEIVSEPVLRSAADAADYLRRLRALVRSLGASDGNMEEGSFRCDANVSLRPPGRAQLGTRCEIKNLNSFRYVERAISYEILRQTEILEQGGEIEQQTLLFDAESGRTRPMRSKEDSHDYRYLPDPDLPPLQLTATRIAALKAQLPELPEAVKQRLMQTHDLSGQAAELLASDRDISDFFTAVLNHLRGRLAAKAAANWLIAELLPLAHEAGWNLAAPKVSAQAVAQLLALIGEGVISGKISKGVFEEMVRSGESAEQIIARLGLVQISDEGAIIALIDRVIAQNPAQLAQYLAGKDKLLGFFVGQIMRESQGKMHPGMVNNLLMQRLAAQKGRD